MKEELQNKLFNQYPEIFSQKDLSEQETCMCWGITCGDGWYEIINVLCMQIQHHIDWENGTGKFVGKTQWTVKKPVPQLEATQVKSKFGELRFYTIGGDKYIDGLVRMAEAVSTTICERCGSVGVLKSQKGHWLSTLCKRCREKEMTRIKNG